MLRGVTAATLLLFQGGCMAMRPVESPGAYLAGNSPGRVVVVDRTGMVTEVAEPKFVADTIFGFNAEGDEVTFPVSDVRQLIARRIHVQRTVLMGIVATAGTVALATAVLGRGEEDKEPICTDGCEPEDAIVPARSRVPARSPLRLLLFRIPW